MERTRPELSDTEPAGDKCHSCDRDFESLFDFPVVKVTAFERTSISTDLVLPDVHEIFVDPQSKSGNRRVPPEVKALFDDENVVKGRRQDGEGSVWRDTVDYDGWQWSRIKYGEDDTKSSYHKAKILLGGGIIIATAVEPYLSQLEGMVNQLVHPSDLKPPEIKIDFPEGTPINLSKDPVRFVRSAKDPTECRLEVESSWGRAAGMTLMNSVAQVGSISYEGRVYK